MGHPREVEAGVREDASRVSEDDGGERLILRDRSVVLVRPLERFDQPLVEAVFDGLGEEARYRRFLAFKKRLSASDLEHLTAVDHYDHEALVALDAKTGAAVGVARMLREAGRPDTAEAAVEVVDSWQGRGLGGLLLERLVGRARQAGVRRFTSVLLTRNLSMLRLFEHTGSVCVTGRYGETLELEVELPFETGAPQEALRVAAAGEVQG